MIFDGVEKGLFLHGTAVEAPQCGLYTIFILLYIIWLSILYTSGQVLNKKMCTYIYIIFHNNYNTHVLKHVVLIYI